MSTPLPPGTGALPPPPQRRPLFLGIAAVSGLGLLTIAGFTWLTFSSERIEPGPAAPGPGDHAPMAVCANSEGTVLRADVNGDGHLDEVRDPAREGVITVEGGGDSWEADLDDALARLGYAGSEDPKREARGTLGDFDGDGYVDLALFFATPHLGDDPVEDMPVHEVHFGPLAQDLTSERVGPLRIDFKGFVYGARAADPDGDGRAELQVFQTEGDGAVDHHVGHYRDDGVTVDGESVDSHDRSSWQGTERGWGDFEVCSDE
ncbi:hypothetical protein ACWGSK_03120 [Nocardiopsis sp. NPDC055551]|uniref:hypothetical protein n=1 Tax=Nocardiopsis sp. NPDC006832 TaxID=3157188 RepID=UPI0033EB1BE6